MEEKVIESEYYWAKEDKKRLALHLEMLSLQWLICYGYILLIWRRCIQFINAVDMR